jgi:hypothetical protein
MLEGQSLAYLTSVTETKKKCLMTLMLVVNVIKFFSSFMRKHLNKLEHLSLGKKFYDNFEVVDSIKLFSSFQSISMS